MNEAIERAAKAYADATGYYVDFHPGLSSVSSDKIRDGIRAAIATLREPNHAITRAMAESCARDDEGEFPIMLDLLDFSGENKAHTVLAQA